MSKVKTMRVRAVSVPVPREGERRTIGRDPVEVEASAYYRRRVARGELELVGEQQEEEE